MKSEQPSGSFTQEIGKDVLFGRESTNSRTERLVDGPPSSQSCVPVSVELVNKDEDADENVDADQTRTVRPVSGQPTGVFTQLEEIDIDFRVSGLPHAVVKQAENFRVRELVKKIESHAHREALQADLQQNNVYKPFSNQSKAMIREMGNVEFFELCETIPKVQCSQCPLSWTQGVIYCTCGHLLVGSESSQKSHKLRLNALSIPLTTYSRRGDSMVLDTAKPKDRESTSSPSTRGRDAVKESTVRKNITKEFASVFFETKYIVNRNSKLAGPSRHASNWISWHRRITPIVYPERNSKDTKDSGISHWTNRARMHGCDFDQTSELQSQSRTVSTDNQAKNVQNPFLLNNIKDGTFLPQVILGGTGTRQKAGGAHEFFFFKKKKGLLQ